MCFERVDRQDGFTGAERLSAEILQINFAVKARK
jgi:hypothetical protein